MIDNYKFIITPNQCLLCINDKLKIKNLNNLGDEALEYEICKNNTGNYLNAELLREL